MADNEIHDTNIIGGRLAGFTAGLYAARARLDGAVQKKHSGRNQKISFILRSVIDKLQPSGVFLPTELSAPHGAALDCGR
jgi:thioredoxin reductase